jgi:hypothetical protein
MNKEINTDYVQLQNPMNKKWVLIDISLGLILAIQKTKFKNVQQYIKKEN